MTAAVLVRTTLAEAGVLLAVLLVTGFLVDRSPEPDVATEAPVAVERSGSEVVVLDDIFAEVVLDPLGIGPTTLTLTMTDPAGEPAEGFEAPRVPVDRGGRPR